MKAAIFLGPERMEVKEVPTPECKPGEILIRIKSCAVCGTDIRTYFHGHHNVKPPQIIGHEIAGVIEKIGSGVEGYKEGDRVTVVTGIGCGRCKYCLKGKKNLCPEFKAIGYACPGGFAEYMIMPKEGVRQGNVLKLPEQLSFDEATLGEPLSCVINGQEYLHIEPGDTAVIIGAGPIGYMHAELAYASGASKVIITDINEKRLGLYQKFRVNRAINAKKENLMEIVKGETENEGANIVIVACPSGQAQEEALKIISPTGRISFFGGLPGDDHIISFDSNIVHYKEVSVYGVFASVNIQYIRALSLLASKKIDASKFITHTFPLEEISKAISAAASGEGLKVMVHP